jgi:hypothetical protein
VARDRRRFGTVIRERLRDIAMDLSTQRAGDVCIYCLAHKIVTELKMVAVIVDQTCTHSRFQSRPCRHRIEAGHRREIAEREPSAEDTGQPQDLSAVRR